ncbi:disease resistance protein RGA5-like [Lolium rigidum]|uniref:disease resistance protein RGA5-like n=1 Tax=Lolium rigidum TaxID=89674 RepID=UPI001F5CC5D8|nr:disease resistance protein RGA5-like [Lolium rigidum]
MDAAAGSMSFLFLNLRKLLKEECNMPAGTKVELQSMKKQLMLLADKEYNILGDVRVDQVEAAISAWLCHTKKLLFDAETLVDSLLVPAGCPEPTANPDDPESTNSAERGVVDSLLVPADSECPEPTDNPDGPESTNCPERADARIRNITERGLSLMGLLSKQGEYIQALYKQEEEAEELVGIDRPRDELIKMLAEGDDTSEKQLKKIFITGIGGSGKTTLARAVYNKLKPQFDCGAFVRAPGFVYHYIDDRESEDVDTSNVEGRLKHAFYLEMLSQLDVENHMEFNKSAFGSGVPDDEIRELLQNKRYLVVLDDTWDLEQFDCLLQILPNNVHDSRIISTIRIDKINRLGLSLSDESVYKIKSIGYPDSRKLFLKQFLVCDCEACCPNVPTDVLNEILKMCGGWPSAIISIALVLSTRVTATKPWEEMLNSVYCVWRQMASFVDFKSDRNFDFEELIQILLLPYSHLPSTLKNCLLYLNVHARNQMIHRTTMVTKWIAAGFISEYVGPSQDELASQYFDELIDRNFIQLVEYGNYLGEEIYEVNYMMHNVLRRLSEEEDFGTVFSDGGTSREYLESICTLDSRQMWVSAMEEISGPTGVRELHIVLHDQPADNDQNHKLLSSIGKFENLEYLKIHGDYNPSDEFPVSLYCPLLERLKIAGRFVKVPKWIAQLSTLKKLYVRVCKIDRDDLKILELYACPGDKFPSGLTNLHSLEKIMLQYSSEYASSGGITNVVAVMKEEACSHRNLIDLSVNGKHEDFPPNTRVEETISDNGIEEDPFRGNGYDEPFLSNTRVREKITGIENKGASNHGNLMELSVDGDREVPLSNTRVHGTITGTENKEASNHSNPMELSVDGDHEVLMSNARVDQTIGGTEIKECY